MMMKYIKRNKKVVKRRSYFSKLKRNGIEVKSYKRGKQPE